MQNNFICFGCQKRGEPVTPCTGLCLQNRCDRGCMPTKICKVLTKKYGNTTTMEIRCGCKEQKCKLCSKHLERKESPKSKMCINNNDKVCACNESKCTNLGIL